MVLRGSKTHPTSEADVLDLRQRIHELEAQLRDIEKEEHTAEIEMSNIVREELLEHDPSTPITSKTQINKAQKHINAQLLSTLDSILIRVEQLESQQQKAQSNLNEYKKQYKITLQQLACGGLAGAVARTTVAPIDRVKLLIQTGDTRGEARQSIVRTALTQIRIGGIKSLWKGNFVNCIRVFPYAAIQFASYERYKSIVLTNITEKYNREFGFLERILSGAMAGGTAATLTYPLDVIRVRQAVYNDIKGPADAIKHIWTESGMLGFFRGWVPTVMSLGPFIACNFATFDYLKQRFIKDGDTKKASSLLVLSLGASAGLFAQSICYPLDTVRRNMQMPGNNFHGTIDCIKQISKRESGLLSFYRGMLPNAIKIVPNNGIRFLAYTKLTAYLGIPTTKIRPKRKD